jgi:hypothetical protein
MPRPTKTRRAAMFVVLLALVFVTIGSGTCVVVEAGPPGAFEGPGENEELMEEADEQAMEDFDR